MKLTDFPKGTVTDLFQSGSRVICDPPPTNTDDDWFIYSEQVGTLAFYLEDNGWTFCGTTQDEYEGAYFAMRKGDVNLIVHEDYRMFAACRSATRLAKRLNLKNKHDRYDLFELAKFGRLTDERPKEDDNG